MNEPSNSATVPLLTIEQMANDLQVSSKTIYYWVGRFEIPFIKVGRHLRFNRDEVVSYFTKKTQDSTPFLGDKLLAKNQRNAGKLSHRALKIRSGIQPKVADKE